MCVDDKDIGAYNCTMKLANGDSLVHVVNLNGNDSTSSHLLTVVDGTWLKLTVTASRKEVMLLPLLVCLLVDY